MNLCELEFAANLENTPWWRITIVHELMHVKHSRIDHFISKVVMPETGQFTCDPLNTVYDQYYEAFTHSMACALVHMAGEFKEWLPPSPAVEETPKKRKR